MLEESIKVITDKRELKGTAYFEIMPGKYKGSCWKDGSIFFDEEVFTLIEPAFERHVPKYDHYAFTDVTKDQWEKILSDLASIKHHLGKATISSELRGVIGELFVSTLDNFGHDFDSNRKKTILLIETLTVWVRRQLEKEDFLAVLGL